MRRWFIAQELDLFRYRFGLENDASVKKFLKVNNLNYTPVRTQIPVCVNSHSQSLMNCHPLNEFVCAFQIPQEEKTKILKNLIDASGDRKSVQVDTENFYKVTSRFLLFPCRCSGKI